MSTMPKLEFTNPVFHEGTNVTVRVGAKWCRHDIVGEYVEVWEAGGEKLFEAHIEQILVCPVWMVPSTWLAKEHDPACRTGGGLIAELSRHYGMTSDTIVTCLAFSRRTKA